LDILSLLGFSFSAKVMCPIVSIDATIHLVAIKEDFIWFICKSCPIIKRRRADISCRV